jgi:hypothetical protein
MSNVVKKLRSVAVILVALWCHQVAMAGEAVFTVVPAFTEARQYALAEFDMTVSFAFTNPYDAADIRLDMTLTAPSGKRLTLPCYYVSGNATESTWKARFAPQEVGTYVYGVEVYQNDQFVLSSVASTFEALPTGGDGFLHARDAWTFQFDSGKPFRGIGENVAWEGRVWERDSYTYDYFLSRLQARGGNYFRTWMCPWNMPLEWRQVVDTDRYGASAAYFHAGGIARMDALVSLAESLGMYMMLAFDWHGALMPGDRWNINPYNTTNGGPAATPTEFFTSAAAKARYKNRLRYIVARWGYSTSIGAWEFFNEIDNAVYNGTENTVAIPHAAVTQWHQEMSAYLKSIDPYNHLVTTSISHREISGLFSVADLDFTQRHVYNATGTWPATIRDTQRRFSKPFVVGEFGYDWDWNNINTANGANLDFDFKRGLWYGLFSPTPVLPMSWWWEFFDNRGTVDYLERVRTVSDRMLASGSGAFAAASVVAGVTNFDVQAVQCGAEYYVFLLNNTSAPTAGRVVLTTATNDVFQLTVYDPETNRYSTPSLITATGNKVKLPDYTLAPREMKVVMLGTPDGTVTGIEEEALPIVLYPNPAQGRFTLMLPLDAESVRVVDLHGVTVASYADVRAGAFVFGEGLRAGVYTVAVRYRSGQSHFIKAILLP